jgi:hypothetical protein
MPHVLNVLKHDRPDLFRQEIRLNPTTFDKLVDELSLDSVFSNNSDSSPQFPVEQQVAIALFRFGHFGNAAGVQMVANWAGVSKGYVFTATQRVMAAVLRASFRNQYVRMPTRREKRNAKRWVARNSCKAWRDGWCFVDGTLIPLAFRPFFYGESYFDRKCNYSLNVQVFNFLFGRYDLLTSFWQIISLPNLRIIDYGFGYTGSAHDSTTWEDTWIFQNHETVFEENEFIWGDSAYPASHLPLHNRATKS